MRGEGYWKEGVEGLLEWLEWEENWRGGCGRSWRRWVREKECGRGRFEERIGEEIELYVYEGEGKKMDERDMGYEKMKGGKG